MLTVSIFQSTFMIISPVTYNLSIGCYKNGPNRSLTTVNFVRKWFDYVHKLQLRLIQNKSVHTTFRIGRSGP